MITPFKYDGSIDYPGVKRVTEWYQKHGIDGIFSVCQSSEMFFLSLSERIELARTVMETINGRMPVIVSAHTSDLIEDQIAELRAVSELEPHAVVIVTNRLAKENESEDVWKENAIKILEAIPYVSFGLYECPYPYKRLLSPELLHWCATTNRFSFLKDTSCDILRLRSKIDAVKNTKLKIFNANTATLLDSLKDGVSGFCGVMLNFHPDIYTGICKYWRENPELAQELQNFATVASLIETQQYPTNAKYHMSLDGVDIGCYTRSKSMSDFGVQEQNEVKALYNHWKQFSMYCFSRVVIEDLGKLIPGFKEMHVRKGS